MKDSESRVQRKLALIVTSAGSNCFFEGQLAFLTGTGWKVAMVSAPGAQLEASRVEGARPFAIPMEREISPCKDVVSLWRLWRFFRHERPDLAVAATPKAGLLGTLAARLAGVPQVVYLLLGLRLETALGWRRWLLWTTEWIACHAAHHVRTVSPSLQAKTVGLGLAGVERSKLLEPGSINGVDMDRLRRSPLSIAAASRLRAQLGIPAEALVLGFVGRLTRDKGIAELFEAFTLLAAMHVGLHLLLVGDFEAGDPVPAGLRERMCADPAVRITGFVREVAPHYQAMDVLVLPTFREGFPGVPLEAQAASVPVVTTDATGATDSILDGVTGLRVPVGDVGALCSAVDRLLADPRLRTSMGASGAAWVEENFKREQVWSAIAAEYLSISESGARIRQTGFPLLMKQVLDRASAALILFLSVPFWLAAALAIRCFMGHPILFRQRRPGLAGRPFTLLKFRTMREALDAGGGALADGERLTRLGRLLRSISLDELPQLVNVLRGEMSLVGPRPLLMEYLPRYSREQARRHEAMPGITGWAQVNGRNAIGWDEKFSLDLWYVDHWSLGLDLSILARTLWKVIGRQGVAADGHATMPEFTGTVQSPAAAPMKHSLLGEPS